MKNIFIVFILLFSQLTQAVVIKGEDSSDHFIVTEELNGKYTFLECYGSLDNYVEQRCSSVFATPQFFSKEEIESMAFKKGLHALGAAGADIGIAVASVFFAVAAAKVEIAWAISAGYSLEGGVGAVSFIIGGAASTTTATTSMIVVDALDPFVHRDLGLALDSVIGEADYGDLDDLDAYMSKTGQVVQVEDVLTSQIVESFRDMMIDILEDRETKVPSILL